MVSKGWKFKTRHLSRPRMPKVRSFGRRRQTNFLDTGWRPRHRDGLDGGRGRHAPPGRGEIDSVCRLAEDGDGGRGLCEQCLPACCCCSCCCCCLNLEYLRTYPGMLRVTQLVLSWICNWLVGRYALRVAATLGSAMPAFFLATAGGALGCSLLLAVALLSARSVALLRASLFEMAFHATAVGLYASQASYLHVATSIYLEPYKNDLETHTYAAVVTTYWLGYFLAALHSLDTVFSLKHYGKFRC